MTEPKPEASVSREECEKILNDLADNSFPVRGCTTVIKGLARAHIALLNSHEQTIAGLQSKLDVLCKPGQATGIVNAMFDFAESECGHNPASARHAFTTIKQTVAELRKWVNCGGAPTGKKCVVDGHEIYGAFFSETANGDNPICELHGYQQQVAELTQRLERAETTREELLKQAVEARSAIRHALQILTRRGGNREECLTNFDKVLAYEPRLDAARGVDPATGARAAHQSPVEAEE